MDAVHEATEPSQSSSLGIFECTQMHQNGCDRAEQLVISTKTSLHVVIHSLFYWVSIVLNRVWGLEIPNWFVCIGIFAYPAGLGDLFTGLLAAFILYRYRNTEIPSFWIVLVAAVGLTDFAVAFFFGFTSSETPVQLFSFENPNQVSEYHLGLIPLFLVPYAVIAHILSLAQLNRDR